MAKAEGSRVEAITLLQLDKESSALLVGHPSPAENMENTPFDNNEGTTNKGEWIRGSELQSPLQLNIFTLLLALATGLFVITTFIYAWAGSTTTGPLSRLIPGTYSDSLLVLQIFTQVTAFVLALLCASTLEVMLWTIASSDSGIPISTLLGISPTTGLLGLSFLLRWKTQPGGRDHHRLWVLIRCFL